MRVRLPEPFDKSESTAQSGEADDRPQRRRDARGRLQVEGGKFGLLR